MRTRLLIILLALLFIASPAIGNDASKYVIGEDDKLIVTTEGGIPDYTEQDETVNDYYKSSRVAKSQWAVNC